MIIFRNINNAFFLLFLTAVTSTLAQEQLHSLSGNFALPTIPISGNLASKTTSVISLDTIPFFDDFSYATKTPYPTTNHWLDSNVYVNTGFPIAPISIGVATFDGLNKKGFPYNISAPLGSSARADTLTSRKINLQKKGALTYSPQDSIYLSFYFQAEGRGDAPESLDELMLEFYKPNQKLWRKVWSRNGYNPSANDTTFKRVMIPLLDTAYYDSLFQFRFVNKATLSGSLDHWHIDYVYLNKNRTKVDTIIEDVTFGYMSTPFLKNYSTMPYRQFVAGEMATNINTYLRNNSLNPKTKSYKFDIYSKTGGASLFNYSGGTNPITPFQPNGWHSNASDFNPTFSHTFPIPTDSTFYKIVHTVSSVPDNVKANDTLVQIQKLSNYYAYDDGTAEQGYYLNAFGAKTAVRFTLNANDTIKALNIYFDPIVDGAAILGTPFRILIWTDGGGSPGSVIFKDSIMYPRYIKGNHNIFPNYKLTSCLQLNAGTYYFGIQQSANKALNIGFDRNTNHMNALYYDIGNGWAQSTIPGSIMINPVIGCYEPPIIISIKEYEKNIELNLFPNPAQNSIIIKSNLIKEVNTTVQFFNTIGQLVLATPFTNNESIDISLLHNGIYFVTILGLEQNINPKKIIITR